MKVVFVVDHYNSVTDGTIITARRFEEELIRQGHDVTVVSYGVSGKNKFGLKENKILIVSAIAKKSNVTFAKFDKKIVEEAIRDADVVHLFMPFSAERKTLKLAKKLKVPVTVAFHVHPDNILRNIGLKKPPRFLTNFIFWLWRVNFYNKAGHIHCPSQFIAGELNKRRYKAKKHVISNGVAPCFVPAEKSGEARGNDGKFEILMVGRLAAEKRQDLLIKAVKGSKYKEKINITFAGSGPRGKKYAKMAEKLPNKPVFKFFTQRELLEKIHNSDLYIHAADVEIEGISCIEAFSCGVVPVIGNAQKSAAKQFIIDERCSFKAGNAASLREKIEYWIENPAAREEMGAKYSEYGMQFKLENSVRQALEMFEEEITSNK